MKTNRYIVLVLIFVALAVANNVAARDRYAQPLQISSDMMLTDQYIINDNGAFTMQPTIITVDNAIELDQVMKISRPDVPIGTVNTPNNDPAWLLAGAFAVLTASFSLYGILNGRKRRKV